MRKGERAKIYMKKKHAFGRLGKVEELRWPEGYADGEGHERLKKEQVIYEVELIDFVEQYDMEANRIFLKRPIKKAHDNEYETAKDIDEVMVDLTFSQDGKGVLWEKKGWQTNMADEEMTLTMNRLI